MTTFQIVSDLHIEYKNDEVPDPLSLITPSANILILAGDIGSFYKYKQLKLFLERLCIYFETVLYIPGNHEYYTIKTRSPKSINQLYRKFQLIENVIPNLYILNRSSVRIGDVCVVGCTLWSKTFNQIPRYICRIHNINTRIYNNLHKLDLDYIKKMINYCSKKKLKLLVITHHCPTFSIIKKQRKKRDKYISLYATNLEYLLKKKFVHTWVCGHIHENFDLITEEGTRLVGNQKGKPKDKIIDYEKDKIIKI